MSLLNWVAQVNTNTSYRVDTSDVSVDDSVIGGILIFSGIWLFFWLAVGIVAVIAMWKVFEKAGQPGWAAIIPIYNQYILVKISGRDILWFLLMFIPLVNLVAIVLVSIDIAKAFGKSEVFGILGLTIFSFIGYAILGFGNAKYQLGTQSGDQPPINSNMTNTPQTPQAPKPPQPTVN